MYWLVGLGMGLSARPAALPRRVRSGEPRHRRAVDLGRHRAVRAARARDDGGLRHVSMVVGTAYAIALHALLLIPVVLLGLLLLWRRHIAVGSILHAAARRRRRAVRRRLLSPSSPAPCGCPGRRVSLGCGYTRMRAVVIGAGVGGLAAAHELAKQGHAVHLVEASPVLGGQVRTFEIGGGRIESFYHHLFRSDTVIAELIEELGLGPDLEWRESKVGMLVERPHLPLHRRARPVALHARVAAHAAAPRAERAVAASRRRLGALRGAAGGGVDQTPRRPRGLRARVGPAAARQVRPPRTRCRDAVVLEQDLPPLRLARRRPTGEGAARLPQRLLRPHGRRAHRGHRGARRHGDGRPPRAPRGRRGWPRDGRRTRTGGTRRRAGAAARRRGDRDRRLAASSRGSRRNSARSTARSSRVSTTSGRRCW